MAEKMMLQSELDALDAAHERVGLGAEWAASQARADIVVVGSAAEVPPWQEFRLPTPSAFVNLDLPDLEPPPKASADVLVPGTDYFVRAHVSADDVVADQAEPVAIVEEDAQGLFVKNSIAFTISREMALDLGVVEPTLEERVERQVRSTRYAVEEAQRRALPAPEVTVEALLDYLGCSPAYAAHVLHPACSCSRLGAEDPFLCSWAGELGFTYDWGTGRVVGP